MTIERLNIHKLNTPLIGVGINVEYCLTDVAYQLFALSYNVGEVHLLQIITFEFQEEKLNNVLKKWLHLLLFKTKEHRLMFGDFRLKREHNIWKATVAGEQWRASIERNVNLKNATLTQLSVKKADHLWQAHCQINIP